MQKKLLTTGNMYKRSDGRWVGVVWYMDESGERKRKSFCGTTKQKVGKKITAYIESFNESIAVTDETKKKLRESMRSWLEVFKFPSVERTTYDRCECTAKNQIYPKLGDRYVGDITAADVKNLLTDEMNDGYAYTTVKKVYTILGEYFKVLYQQEQIPRNPMTNVEMIKRSNFMAGQGKENLPVNETVTIFTEDELNRFKTEAFRTNPNGRRRYQQSAAYILMLNTGIRTGEALGLMNSDIDLENRVMHVRRGVKEIYNREGTKATSGRSVNVGKLKSMSSKRDVPLNNTAIEMIKDLRKESYYGEDSPLIPDENGNYTRPVNFRKRYYRILKAAKIEKKGLHSFRHTFATRLVNGIKQADGTIRSLTPRQVADILGHSTSQITELYYVKKDTKRLSGLTNEFEL